MASNHQEVPDDRLAKLVAHTEAVAGNALPVTLDAANAALEAPRVSTAPESCETCPSDYGRVCQATWKKSGKSGVPAPVCCWRRFSTARAEHDDSIAPMARFLNLNESQVASVAIRFCEGKILRLSDLQNSLKRQVYRRLARSKKL
jgi:hypothetical protein